MCFFLLLVSRIFFIWFVLQDRTIKKAGTIKIDNTLKFPKQITRSLFVLLKLHLVSFCHYCLISDGWNLFLSEVYGGGLHNRSGPLSGQAKCHNQHWNNRTRYCPTLFLIWLKIFTLYTQIWSLLSHFAEPGYIATPIAMVQAAITLLNEPHSLPNKWVISTSIAGCHTWRNIYICDGVIL